MPTYNKILEHLTLDEIHAVSERFLMGWQDLMAEGYGFRVKGLNRKRREHGLRELTKEWSEEYRVAYIRSHYTQDEIRRAIADVLVSDRVAETRWDGIFILDCRFGQEYARVFRELLGSSEYRRLSEETRVQKLVATQMEKYNGVGLAGENALEKARQTCQARYGVDNPMQAAEIKSRVISPFASPDVTERAAFSRWKNIQDRLSSLDMPEVVQKRVLRSPHETVAFCELVSRFGRDDVLYEYGIHPSDPRYPHDCDFYIKSLDLFIEMHCHYGHGDHWYDPNNHDDVLRRWHLLTSDSVRSRASLKTWCDTDVLKRADARKSGIKYLVFWDGQTRTENGVRVPRLRDFYMWFLDYDCDYDKFIANHPENTY